MNYFFISLQFVSIAILVCGWGKILSSILRWNSKPERLIPSIALNFIVGSTFLFLFGYLVARTTPSVFQYLGPLLLIPAFLVFLRESPSLISRIRSVSAYDWIMIFLLTVLASVFLYRLVSIPYPGMLTQGMGDIPSYYRVSQNLLEGKGLLNDVTILDYPGAHYFPPTTHGLASIIGAIVFGIFGSNHFSLDLYTLLASLLCLGMSAECIRKLSPHSSENEGLIFPLFCLAPLLFFDSIPVFAVSHVSFLPLLGILSFFLLGFANGTSLSKKTSVIHILFLVFSHPIGVFFLAGIGIYSVVGYCRKSKLAVIVTALSLLLAISLVIFYRNTIIEKNLTTLSYVRYSEHKGFYYVFKPWSMLNINYVRNALGLESDLENRNLSVFRDILQHPLDFLYFLFEWIKRQLFDLFPITMALAGICAFQVYRRKVSAAFLLIPLVYFLFHRILSANMNLRHFFSSLVILWIPSGILILEGFAKIRTKWGTSAGKISSTVLFCLGTFLLIFLVDQDLGLLKIEQNMMENRGYTIGLETIRENLKPDDLIASDYPQITAFLLNTRTVGASTLGANEEELSVFLERYKPEFWYFSDFFKRGIYEKNIYRTDLLMNKYRKIFESPQNRLIVYRKMPEKN